ncbi:MAG: methylated-DNA--[protein]-cysteine S-methyltransferase [Planctomycetia bacterium]|nr:methylated-DNA--[protein]-cysteine S-methyltransferase [Planctomycetia bacterium]
MIYCQTRKTAFGPITICVESGCITVLIIGSSDASRLKKTIDAGNATMVPENDQLNSQAESALPKRDSALLAKAFSQLEEYFAGKRRKFSLPLNPKGTPFMQQVWQALCEIPYGTVISYQELAERIGNRRATRAVGQANHRNPIPVFIPCHRVISKDGGLGGYECGLDTKERLLALEGVLFASK